MNHNDFLDDTPFPFRVNKTGVLNYDLECPINDMLDSAIKKHRLNLTALEEIYMESSKLFPSIAIKPSNIFNLEGESDKLIKWIEHSLQNISSEIQSLYFTYIEEEIPDGDDYITTYAISLYGADSYDENFEWIEDSKKIAKKVFLSKTLDQLYQLNNKLSNPDDAKKNALSMDQFFGRIAFLENIILYGYCVLLVAKAIKSIENEKLKNQISNLKITFGIDTDSEIIPYQAIELTYLK
jgi:hypothetical protein